MQQFSPSQNKAIVIEAFETLFNRRDTEYAKRFWSRDYIQHSALVPAGRDGLFSTIKNSPEMRYEHQLAGRRRLCHDPRTLLRYRPSELDRRRYLPSSRGSFSRTLGRDSGRSRPSSTGWWPPDVWRRLSSRNFAGCIYNRPRPGVARPTDVDAP